MEGMNNGIPAINGELYAWADVKIGIGAQPW